MTPLETPTRGGPSGTGHEAARERSHLYGFLAAVFGSEPGEDLLKFLRDPDFKEALARAGVDVESLLGGDADAEVLENLAVEYTRLFLGPGPHVSPHAAVYLDGDGASLCGPATVWVREFIERHGLAFQSDYHGLPDHICVELAFMREITAQLADAVEAGEDGTALALRSTEREFVLDHMAQWIPEFCENAAAQAELPFYRELARLTSGFVQSEIDALKSSSFLPRAIC